MKVIIEGTIIVYMDGVDIEQARMRERSGAARSMREIIEDAAHTVVKKRNQNAVLVKSDIRGMSNATITFRIKGWHYSADTDG